jgi:glyoxylase-like metal-dependent hydrolase (beta-lactamase superfamily II)
MLRVGDIEIYLVNDAYSMADGGGPFGLVPRKLWQQYVQPDADNLVPMCHLCLIVKSGGKIAVVDTGYGDKLNEKVVRNSQMTQMGGLLRGLAHLGIRPEDVNLVMDTHLHGDHCGGNTRFQAGSPTEVEPVFSNAEYVVQRREYEDAMHPNERTRATYLPYNYAPLVASGQMRLLDGDSELLPGIQAIVTPGHTPAHMSIRFESQGEYAAFLCDLATYAVHIERLAWMTAYDVEPLRTLETKRFWQKWALETHAFLMFPHDTHRPIGRLTQTGDEKYEIIPAAFPVFNWR